MDWGRAEAGPTPASRHGEVSARRGCRSSRSAQTVRVASSSSAGEVHVADLGHRRDARRRRGRSRRRTTRPRSPRPWRCSRRCRGSGRSGRCRRRSSRPSGSTHSPPARPTIGISLTSSPGLLGEGEADPAEAGLGALDAGDDGVVVGLRGVVLAGRLDLLLGDGPGLGPGLADVSEDDLDEAVVGAGLLARSGDVEGGVGERRCRSRARRRASWASLQLSKPSDSGPIRA